MVSDLLRRRIGLSVCPAPGSAIGKIAAASQTSRALYHFVDGKEPKTDRWGMKTADVRSDILVASQILHQDDEVLAPQRPSVIEQAVERSMKQRKAD